jgi:Flp pilus assembly protein TadD
MSASVADEVVLLSHDVAAVFNDLGVLMAVRGNVKEAERFYRRSLEIKQRLLANDDPELALTRRNLAVLPAC